MLFTLISRLVIYRPLLSLAESFSDNVIRDTVDEPARGRLFEAAFLIEREMISYFKPEKINWASFGNMLPRVHMHIQARFKDDEFFPEPMWGAKQREGDITLPPMEPFLEALAQKMQEHFDKDC